MSSNKEYPLTLEYFCFENEDIWNQSDEFIINLGVKELKKLFKDEFNVLTQQFLEIARHTRNKNWLRNLYWNY